MQQKVLHWDMIWEMTGKLLKNLLILHTVIRSVTVTVIIVTTVKHVIWISLAIRQTMQSRTYLKVLLMILIHDWLSVPMALPARTHHRLIMISATFLLPGLFRIQQVHGSTITVVHSPSLRPVLTPLQLLSRNRYTETEAGRVPILLTARVLPSPSEVLPRTDRMTLSGLILRPVTRHRFCHLLLSWQVPQL